MSDSNSDAVKLATKWVGEGVSPDEIVVRLQAQSYPIIAVIRALALGANVSLADAKRIVHFSPAYAQQRAKLEDFHDTVEKAFKDWNA